MRILKQPIQWIEDRIGDGGCFLKEGESKKGGWSNRLTKNYLIDIFD